MQKEKNDFEATIELEVSGKQNILMIGVYTTVKHTIIFAHIWRNILLHFTPTFKSNFLNEWLWTINFAKIVLVNHSFIR